MPNALDIVPFLRGAIAMGAFVAALFFFRFFRTTRDSLFAWLALSFVLQGLDRLGLALTRAPAAHTALYFVRFGAYAMILFAIAEKNLARRKVR